MTRECHHSGAKKNQLTVENKFDLIWFETRQSWRPNFSPGFILNAAGHQPVGSAPHVVIANKVKHRGALWRIRLKFMTACSSTMLSTYCQRHTTYGPLWMMPSTKPEVHNVFHCRQKRTEPLPRVTCTENLVKFGRAVFEICSRADKQTNRHTDTLIAILRTLPGRNNNTVINVACLCQTRCHNKRLNKTSNILRAPYILVAVFWARRTLSLVPRRRTFVCTTSMRISSFQCDPIQSSTASVI